MKSLAFKPDTSVLDNLEFEKMMVRKAKSTPKAWVGWTMSELSLAVKLRAYGASLGEVADLLGRSYGSVAGAFNKHPQLRKEADDMRKVILKKVMDKYEVGPV